MPHDHQTSNAAEKGDRHHFQKAKMEPVPFFSGAVAVASLVLAAGAFVLGYVIPEHIVPLLRTPTDALPGAREPVAAGMQFIWALSTLAALVAVGLGAWAVVGKHRKATYGVLGVLLGAVMLAWNAVLAFAWWVGGVKSG